MFKRNLLLSTALLATAALSSSAARSGESARSSMSELVVGPVRDANDEFMSNYGGCLAVSAIVWASLGGHGKSWRHVAFPIVGGGKTVKRIEVKEEQAPSTQSPQFYAGLYSNSPSGVPGTLIASGTGTAPQTYGTVIVPIAPTTLKRHTRYWVVEEVADPHLRHSGAINESCWKPYRHTKRKAYVQRYVYAKGNSSSGQSSTTPWTKQTTGAYVRLK